MYVILNAATCLTDLRAYCKHDNHRIKQKLT